MNWIKKFFTVFCIVFFYSVKSNAQHVVQVPNIDLIAHNNETFMLYEKITEDTFRPVDVWFRNQKRDFKEATIERENFTHTLANINELYGEIIWTDQLKPNGFNDLKNKQWLVNTKRVTTYERYLFKFTNHNLVTYQEFEASFSLSTPNTYQAPYKVIHDFMIDQKPTQSVWMNIDQVWYQPIILDFGNGKHIIILPNTRDFDFTFIPLTEEIKVISEEIECKNITPIAENSYIYSPYDYFNHFKFSNIYQTIRDGKKYRLHDLFGNDLLGKTFDRIDTNQHYIVIENNRKYTVFNLILNQLAFPEIQKFYLNEYGIEILTKTEAYYIIEGLRQEKYPITIGSNVIDNDTQTVSTAQKTIYKRCEKVTKSFYKIVKNEKSGWLDVKTMEEYFFD